MPFTFQTNHIQFNPIKHMVDGIVSYRMPPLSSDASKWNNISTLGINLRDFGLHVGVEVVVCAIATILAYMGTNNDLGGDDNCSIILYNIACRYT